MASHVVHYMMHYAYLFVHSVIATLYMLSTTFSTVKGLHSIYWVIIHVTYVHQVTRVLDALCIFISQYTILVLQYEYDVPTCITLQLYLSTHDQ